MQQAHLWSALAYATVLGMCLGVVGGWWWLRSVRDAPVRHAPSVSAGLGLLLATGISFGCTGWRAAEFRGHAMPTVWEGVDVRIRGVVTDVPRAMQRGKTLLFQVEQAHTVTVPTQPLVLPSLVQLTWFDPPAGLELRAGQRWTWTVRLKAPHGERNPHGMDWELWMWMRGIQATGYVRATVRNVPPQYLEQTGRYPLAQWRGRLLESMQEPVAADTRQAASFGVVQALVTGAQSRITTSDWQFFRDAGIAHLVSISGLHITMFAWLAMAVVRRLWRASARCCHWLPAPVAGAWCGWALAAGYAVFSGWGIPAQRTVGMLALMVVLQSQARAWPWSLIWLCVLSAVVLADPWALLQPGFWLSFVAVGVLFAAQHRSRWSQGSWLRRGAGRLLAEQAVVGIALAPLSLVLFGQVSVVGMLANLVAIPWMTLVVTPLSMLGVLIPEVWGMAAQGVTLMVTVLQPLTQWEGAVWYFARPPWWAALAGGLAAVWLVLPIGWRWRCWALPCMVPMLVWRASVPALGAFELVALDVGQGAAVVIQTHAHTLLFDAGPAWSLQRDAGERVVVPVLRAWGRSLDRMVVSHADQDHAGGARSVQHAFPNVEWLGSGGKPCEAGQSWEWDGVHFAFLHPPLEQLGTLQRANARSCVLRVQAAHGQVALLTGDIEASQERALLAAGAPVSADVVLMPHHGSASSSSRAWVAAVSPRVAVAQAGYLHRFGHPHPAVLARYHDVGSMTVSTADCGAATWRSWHPGEVRCERRDRRKYWQSPAR